MRSYRGVFLVVVVILTVSLMSTGSSSSTPVEIKGSDALNSAPLIIGYNNLPQNIKLLRKNKVSDYNFTGTWKDDTVFAACTTCQTDYPKLRTGKVATQIWTVNIDCTAKYKDAVSQTVEQIDVIQRFISSNPSTLSSVQNQTEIKSGFKNSPTTIGSLISVNGGHSIDSRLGVLRMYYQLGVRVMALAASSCSTPWSSIYKKFNDSANTDDGINAFGERVVLEMNRLGMVIDLSGSSHQTQLEVLDKTKAPVIFSHSAAAGKFNAPDNVLDDVLDKLKNNKGLFMVTFSPKALVADIKNVSMSDVVAQIEYVKTKIGAGFVGIGGAYDVDTVYPSGLSDISTIGNLFDYLYTKSSWTITELEGLAGNNFLKLLTNVESVKEELAKTPTDETWEEYTDFTEITLKDSCFTDFTQRYNITP